MKPAVNDRIRKLLEQVRLKQEDLEEALREEEQRVSYRIRNERVEFEQKVHEAHQRLRMDLLRWIADSQWRNVASAPFIYGMIVPIALFDIGITLYQHLCFRLYGIGRVRRADYIVFDRHRLGYLNAIEKLNCLYCGYANGLMAYAREIIGRTEQYWCPIKHARKVRDAHKRYAAFVPYGEAEALHEKFDELRQELCTESQPAQDTPRAAE